MNFTESIETGKSLGSMFSRNSWEPDILYRSKEQQDLLDADILLGADKQGSISGVIEELESRGYDVESYSASEIEAGEDGVRLRGIDAEELEGKTSLLRNKRGFEDSTEEAWALSQYVDFVNHPLGAAVCDNKNDTHSVLEAAGVSTVESYNEAGQIRELLEDEKKVVSKPGEGLHGNGFEILESAEDFEYDDERVYEEMVDHWEGDWVERRAVTYEGEGGFKLAEVKDREGEDFQPKNINSNGSYSDPEFIYEGEVNELRDASEAVGGGLLGIDYVVNRETGEKKIIEVNATVGLNGIREASDADIDQILADYMENDINGESYGEEADEELYADHLEEKVEAFEPEKPETEASYHSESQKPV